MKLNPGLNEWLDGMRRGSIRHDGLAEDEGCVMDALTEAVAAFDQLEEQHPNDTHEFYSAIHVAQDLLAVRIARRLYPEGWPTHAD